MDQVQAPSIDSDLAAEQKPLSLAQAVQYVPKTRGPVAPTTIFRWITRGIRGVRLEGRRAPNGWFTTVGALSRFYQALTDQRPPPTLDSQPSPRTPTRRQLGVEAARRHEAAKELLRRRGIL